MDVQLTEEEVKEVDRLMGEHVYRHSISNSYSNFTCNATCRTLALMSFINRVLEAKKTEPAAHPLLTHRNGDKCIWIETGDTAYWFVPYDAGGEGVDCPYHDNQGNPTA